MSGRIGRSRAPVAAGGRELPAADRRDVLVARWDVGAGGLTEVAGAHPPDGAGRLRRVGHVREPDVEPPGQRRLHLLDRPDRAAGPDRGGAPGAVDDLVELLAAVGAAAELVELVVELVLRDQERTRDHREGDQRPQRERGTGAEPAAEEHDADAREHAADRRRGHVVAGVAGVAGLRHDRDEQHPRGRAERQELHDPVADRRGHERRQQHRPGDHTGEVDQDLQPGDVGVRRRDRAARAEGGLRRPEGAAGADHVRPEPEHGEDAERGAQLGHRRLARAPQPEHVEADERPRLGPHQPARDREPERHPRSPVEVRQDRPQGRGGEDRLAVAERGVEEPPVGDGHRRRGDHAGERAGEPVAEHRRARQGEQAACARDEQPQDGRRVPGEREDRRRDDRQRLPRGPVGGVQRQVRDVAAPADPRPRVERDRPGQQQGQRGEAERPGDQPEHVARAVTQGRRAAARRR